MSIKLVRETSLLHKNRGIRPPEDGYDLVKSFLEDKDRKNFIEIALDTKKQPVSINVCHIGSLNASLVSPREVMKTVILSSAASIIVAHKKVKCFSVEPGCLSRKAQAMLAFELKKEGFKI